MSCKNLIHNAEFKPVSFDHPMYLWCLRKQDGTLMTEKEFLELIKKKNKELEKIERRMNNELFFN